MVENLFFSDMKGNFGLGCKSLPMIDDEIDYNQFNRMIDYFLAQGFNYIDVAPGYMNGNAEEAIKKCLVDRYNRDLFVVADKISEENFNSVDDVQNFFENQLKKCGLEYFDFYLMDGQTKKRYKKFQKYRAYETMVAMKNIGYIKHIGISYYGKSDALKMILNEHPEIEFVQFRYNYYDYYDKQVESKKLYEICERYNKPIIAMEPNKGGKLANLPEEAEKILKNNGYMSNASYALRFAGSFPRIAMVLSNMSSVEQVKDNMWFMAGFEPVCNLDMELIVRVTGVLKKLDVIQCTKCRYCVEKRTCRSYINIPMYFAAYNAKKVFPDWDSDSYYDLENKSQGRPSDCIKCGQ